MLFRAKETPAVLPGAPMLTAPPLAADDELFMFKVAPALAVTLCPSKVISPPFADPLPLIPVTPKSSALLLPMETAAGLVMSILPPAAPLDPAVSIELMDTAAEDEPMITLPPLWVLPPPSASTCPTVSAPPERAKR